MAYSELIKNFSKIREYMTQFYIYGFKSRKEYNNKSARSYDNERRRMESWLGDYMSFHQDANGRNTFIAVDSRSISHNPLYNAFKAKSFTDNDIMLHFYLLDILSDHTAQSVRKIADTISSEYLSMFDDYQIDESTIRKKLKEYENLGILKSIIFYRLDSIKKISLKDTEAEYEKYSDSAEKRKRNLWGVSIGRSRHLEHIEITLFVEDDEQYIVHRLNREKRYGTVTAVDKNHYKFTADIYDAMEMMPWIRTFIGRITKLECSNDTVVKTFYSDLEKMKAMYGGDGNAVQ